MKNLTNPYHPQEPQAFLMESDPDPATTFAEGLHHNVDDWVKLELTAEQMLSDEIDNASIYIAGDAKQMWEAIKDGLLPYELVAEQWLMDLADPSVLEWHLHDWWTPDTRH